MSKSWIGETIGGRYEIDSLLGQGGMSAVYRATDPNLRRMVAIKLIHPHLSVNPNFVNRFKEEAAAVARLRHPHIVQVHDFDVDGETYFMVMEHLTGESLQAHLNRLNKSNRYMPYPKVIQICSQMCDALGYAHRHELIHRDIKPANIMLDIHGQAILMDFGIVKIIGGEYHTATGATLGTVKYMSPEQMRSEKVDEQSDIYSLGVTLYEMISGRVPYMADSVPTLMMMALNDPLPDLRSIRKGIPEALIQVVEKALAKQKTDRFQTMEDMAAGLDHALQAVENIQSEATVLDEDVPEAPVQPVQPGHAPPSEVRRDARPAPAQEAKRSERATVVDSPPEAQAKPRKPRLPKLKVTLPRNLRRILLAAVALLLVGGAVAVGIVYLRSQNPPVISLSPIDLPDEPMSAQNAGYIVRLGSWETDSTIVDMVFSPDGTLLGTANNRDQMRFSPHRYYGALWRVATGELQQYLQWHTQWMYSVAFSPDGQQFATSSDDDNIILWEISEDSPSHVLQASMGGITALEFSPNNLLLASGSWGGTIGLWGRNGQLLRTFGGADSSILDLAFSPDGSMIASALEDNTAQLWQVSDGTLLYSLEYHTAPVQAVSFSADGRWLVTASEDHTLGLWQVSDGSFVKNLEGHSDTIRAVAFSPDSSLLVSGADDGKILLWQVTDGAMLRQLDEYSESISALDFSPGGMLLASVAWDGAILFWGLSEALQPEAATPTMQP